MLKGLTFNEQNTEIAKRWQDLNGDQRMAYIQRAKDDLSLLDNETRVKRQLKKVNSAVSYHYIVD